MKYRFRLGKYLGDNLITDPTFAAACGVNWQCGTGWSIAGNKATHTGAVGHLSAGGIFTQGEKYQINFDVVDTALGIVKVYLAGFSITNNPDNTYFKYADGSYSITGKALKNDPALRIFGYGNVAVKNVYVYQLLWNDPIECEPKGWNESKLQLKKSELLDNLFVTLNTELTFWGDGYDYLLSVLNDSSNCGEVPVLIERQLQDGLWETHFEGLLYLNKCDIDIRTKTIKGDIYDSFAAKALAMGKDKEITTGAAVGSMFAPNSLPSEIDNVGNLVYEWRNVGVYIIATGAYASKDYIYDVFKVVRNIVHEISNLEATVESSLFNDTPYGIIDPNPFKYLSVAPIRTFSTDNKDWGIKIPLSEIINDINTILNISMFTSLVSNIITLNIESTEYLLGTSFAPVITVDNNNCIFQNNNDSEIQCYEIGYQKPSDDDINFLVQKGAANAGQAAALATITSHVNYYNRKYNVVSKCATESKSSFCSIGASWFILSWQMYGDDSETFNGLPQHYFVQLEEDGGGGWQSATWLTPEGHTWGNPDLNIPDIMDSQIISLQNSYYDTLRGIEQNKTNIALKYIWEFSAMITLSQLNQILKNPVYYLKMSSKYLTSAKNAYIVEFTYDNNSNADGSSLATFKVITE